MRRLVVFALAAAAAGCTCPTTPGNTAPAVTQSMLLAPGELRYFDVDTPAETTQINLTVRMDPSTIVRLLHIDPACAPVSPDSCGIFADKTYSPRPAGVRQFGDGLSPRGPRTRIVLVNPSDESSAFVELTVQPYRAGCT